ASDVRRRAARVGFARLVGEDGDQPSVARIEIQMALRLLVEVRLLENEGHAEHAFPEVDRGLPVRSNERDVMDALCLKFSHDVLPSARSPGRLTLRPTSPRVSTCSPCAEACPRGQAPPWR